MKKIIVVLVACVLILPVLVKGQTQVMVGDTGLVFMKPAGHENNNDPNCKSYTYEGAQHDSIKSEFSLISAQNQNLYGPRTDSIFFIPTRSGLQKDNYHIIFRSKDQRFSCVNASIYHYFVNGVGIDSMTTVKIVYPSVVQPIDTSESQYLPNNIGAFFSMYNNVSDSSTFSNWQLVVSDSAKLTFTIDTAGTELSSYLMEPFTRKRQLNFTFTTELAPIETERVFPAKLLTTVTTAGKDSVYENALLFRFPPLQPKSVHGVKADDGITITISPNPTELNATLSFGHNRSEAISIELYDVLGNRKMVLADGIYESGVHTIPIDTKDLPQGSYFVRLQASGQVVTKKLIVR